MVPGVWDPGERAHGLDGDLCNATTYYARFRYDGKWDFEKEPKHPGSYYTSAPHGGRWWRAA